jgi:hypothetical protein
MLNPFDILKIEDNRRVTWIRAIGDFERAKSYILKVLAIAAPADYLILNQRTGARTVIRAAAETRKRRSKSPWSTVSSSLKYSCRYAVFARSISGLDRPNRVPLLSVLV